MGESVLRTGNALLDSLHRDEHRVVVEACSLQRLVSTQPVHVAGRPYRYVYFPVDCVISLMIGMEAGAEAELVSIGREGIHGSRSLLGVSRATYDSYCSLSGHAYRMGLGSFRKLATPGTLLRTAALRYQAVGISTMSRLSGCNRFHQPVQRCARWLLLAQDRTAKDSFELTHELLGRILGTHRPAASSAMAQLQRAEALSTRRGKVTIRSRRRLRAMSCECYGKVASELKWLP